MKFPIGGQPLYLIRHSQPITMIQELELVTKSVNTSIFSIPILWSSF